jgi:uncharacterized protein (TIGR01777 family)
MRVLITGATGFVGRALVARLLREGHQPVAWVRSPERAASQVGGEAELAPAGDDADLARLLSGVDAVVNLAGANVFGRRWSARYKKELMDSRVGLTARLVQAMGAADPRPGVLVSASGIGYYGDRGQQELDESGGQGDDFLARLSGDWEQAAAAARDHGARVALLRTGTVLGPEGGALQRLLPLFRMGLGGRLGSGRQYMAWIHLHDLVELITSALTDERLEGPLNVAAPEAVTNRHFTRVLAQKVARPALLPAPGPLLRLALGQAAGVLLGGQRAVPARLLQAGFSFRYPTLESTLDQLLDPTLAPAIAPIRGDGPIAGVRPRYRLEQQTRINAPLDVVFPFFSEAANLGLLTPAWTDLRLTGAPPRQMRKGTEIDYTLKLGPLRSRWRSEITVWEPGVRFVDHQTRGPYRLWWHEHRFAADGQQTLMTDRVHYALPLPPFGRLAHPLLVAPALRRIFAYRLQMMGLRFGVRQHQ